ncbi:MAG: DUF2460 domain-containing protein [Burkholderiales bacterium]
MAYSGLSFPALQYGNKFRDTKIKSDIPVKVVQNSGYEYRVLRFKYARLSWEIPAVNLTWQDKETLLAFWNALGGSLQSFSYMDPEHNSVTNANLGAGTQISAPGAPTLAAVTGGSLVAATYYYGVTAYNAEGETILSTVASITTTATGSVTITWASVSGATGYRVYGRVSTGHYLLADVGSALTYTDTGAALQGVAAPTSNTTGVTNYPMLLTIAGLPHPIFHLGALSVSPSNFTLTVINGTPTLVYPVGSAPLYGSSVVVTGSYQLTARFDSTAGYTLANAVNPSLSAVGMDKIRLMEVFE